jgi:hypothetical protein
MSEIGDASDLAIPDEPLPVSVLTGFLGSGKTTVPASSPASSSTKRPSSKSRRWTPTATVS